MQFSSMKEWITANSNIKSAKTYTEEKFSARVDYDNDKSLYYYIILFELYFCGKCWIYNNYSIFEAAFPYLFKTTQVKPIVWFKW